MENRKDPRRPITGIHPPQPGSSRIRGLGEMAEEIRGYPWETSFLGAIDDWSPTLLAMVNVVLNSPVPAAIYWGPQMSFICNDASMEAMGAKPAEILGLPAEALWGTHWPDVKDQFQAVMSSGESFHGESVPVGFRRDGKSEDIFIDYSLSPIYDDDRVAGIFRVLEETTETVLALRALSESDARLRMALSVGKCVGVWDWNIPKGIVFSDETVAGFYGIDPEAAAAGTSSLLYEQMLHPDDIVVLTDAIMGCLTSGKDFSVDYRVRRPDNTYRWIQSRGRCIYDDQGHALRITGLKLDITSQRLNNQPAPPSDNVSRNEALQTLPPSIAAFVSASADLLAEFPSEVEVKVIPAPTGTQIILRVAETDLGKLIGKQGRIIRAIRTLLYTVTTTLQQRFSIDIESNAGPAERPNRN